MLLKLPRKKELGTLPLCFKPKGCPRRNAKNSFIRYARSVNHSLANKKHTWLMLLLCKTSRVFRWANYLNNGWMKNQNKNVANWLVFGKLVLFVLADRERKSKSISWYTSLADLPWCSGRNFIWGRLFRLKQTAKKIICYIGQEMTKVQLLIPP